MKGALYSLGASFGLLLLGISICIPGICGCAQLIRGVDGDRFATEAFLCDGLGLVGIACSVLAMVVILIRRAEAERLR